MLKSLKKKKDGTFAKRGKAAGRARIERPLVCDHARVEVPEAPAAEPPLVRVPEAPAAEPPLVRVPEAPAAEPPLVRGPRAPQARPGDRIVEYCDLGTLSEVMGGGRIIGYGITCGRHRNAADKPNTVCKKQCLLGRGPRAISHHEAKLRLKRWFVAGQFLEPGWPAGKQRAHHPKAGGTSLPLFAAGEPGWSEMSEDELNEACCMPPAV